MHMHVYLGNFRSIRLFDYFQCCFDPETGMILHLSANEIPKGLITRFCNYDNLEAMITI